MNGRISKIEVETTFTLTRRELEILNHLTAYNNKDWVKGMKSTHYNGGVNEKDMIDFLDNLHKLTSDLMTDGNKIKAFRT